MRCILVHSALADARMWEPVIPWFQGHEPISYDLRGHGQSDDADGDWHHVDDLLELLDGEPAVLVGSSLGGRVALEAAVLRPDLVPGLVLLAPGLSDWEWGPAFAAYDEAEERLLAQGDLEAVAVLNVDFWVVGVGRPASAVPRDVRELVMVMQRRALALEAAFDAEESPRVAGLRERVGELRMPALVVVGEHDVPDMHAIARFLADAIPGAEHAGVPGTGHLPSLEAPADTGPLIERFLKRF